MVLSFDEWRFDVDITETMTVSGEEVAEHCVCGSCRNFYRTVDDRYPDLRTFLSQFGLDLEAPDELIPCHENGEVWYTGCYSVCGKILHLGKRPMLVDGVDIQPSREFPQINFTSAPEPCFYLILRDIRLPWALPEPPEVYSTPQYSSLSTGDSVCGSIYLS